MGSFFLMMLMVRLELGRMVELHGLNQESSPCSTAVVNCLNAQTNLVPSDWDVCLVGNPLSSAYLDCCDDLKYASLCLRNLSMSSPCDANPADVNGTLIMWENSNSETTCSTMGVVSSFDTCQIQLLNGKAPFCLNFPSNCTDLCLIGPELTSRWKEIGATCASEPAVFRTLTRLIDQVQLEHDLRCPGTGISPGVKAAIVLAVLALVALFAVGMFNQRRRKQPKQVTIQTLERQETRVDPSIPTPVVEKESVVDSLPQDPTTSSVTNADPKEKTPFQLIDSLPEVDTSLIRSGSTAYQHNPIFDFEGVSFDEEPEKPRRRPWTD